jgi:hypothetical protein
MPPQHERTEAEPTRGRRVGRESGLRGGDESRERGGLCDGEIGEDASVHLDAGQVEALDEAVVGEAVRARRGVDALDPQATEVTLASTTVTVRVDEGVGDLLLGLAVETRPLAAIALGALEDYPTLLVGVDCPLYSCHFLFLILEVCAGVVGVTCREAS